MHERLREARRAGVAGVVVMADVDLFKSFNDRNGHDLGDALLRAIAQRLQAFLPGSAELGRCGGDEFLVFLPRTDVAQAEPLIRKCLDHMRESIVLAGAANEIVTLSAGVASFAGQTTDEVLRACDIAMYAAKARGRDRVVVFDDDTRQIVTARRELASTVIELQRRNRVLREEARTDALTGVRNRLALDEILDLAVGGDDLPWAEASVAFIDVDHFSEFNHLHGDASGDEALRSVAAALRGSTREADMIFRKGGEEFAIVLPGTGEGAAGAAAERMRASIEDLAIQHLGSAAAPVLTVTVGVASGGAGHTVRQLLNAAAEQTMAAKVKDRRNRVHPARLDPAPGSPDSAAVMAGSLGMESAEPS